MTISNDFNLLRKFILKTLNYAKSDRVSKDKLIDILEQSFNDSSCPLAWTDAVLVRLNND